LWSIETAICWSYHLKRKASAKNGEIGEMLGGMGAEAVAKGCQRFVTKLEEGREMAREAGQIGRELSRVKG
jgi:hypothetical protein